MKENPSKKWHNLWSTDDLMEITKLNPVTSQDIINLTNTLITHKTLNRLHEIKNKTLILAGEKDRIASKVQSEQLHQGIPYSTLKIFSGGHWFNLEQAPEVNQTIIDFLEKQNN